MQADHFTHLVNLLAAMSGGNRTLLDDCVVVWGDALGNGPLPDLLE